MLKIILMAGAAMLMAAPAFADGHSTPSPETITGGSNSSVSSYGSSPYVAGQNAYAGSSSNIGIQNDSFKSWNTDKTTTTVDPVAGNDTYITDVSKTTTNTTGTGELEGGTTASSGGETGGANFTASGYEYGTVTENPNAGGNGDW